MAASESALMSITSDGFSTSSFIRSTRVVPPAMKALCRLRPAITDQQTKQSGLHCRLIGIGKNIPETEIGTFRKVAGWNVAESSTSLRMNRGGRKPGIIIGVALGELWN